jgi:hypothetical protein
MRSCSCATSAMRATSAGGVTVPVGLLGLIRTRIFDFGVMWARTISAVRVKFVSIVVGC